MLQSSSMAIHSKNLHQWQYIAKIVVSQGLGNSLLQKCREMLRTEDPKWSDPAQAVATCTGLPY
jgi:hypothetical protein